MNLRLFNVVTPIFAHDGGVFPFLALAGISGLTCIICVIASLVAAIKHKEGSARRAATFLIIGAVAAVVFFCSPWIILQFFI